MTSPLSVGLSYLAPPLKCQVHNGQGCKRIIDTEKNCELNLRDSISWLVRQSIPNGLASLKSFLRQELLNLHPQNLPGSIFA